MPLRAALRGDERRPADRVAAAAGHRDRDRPEHLLSIGLLYAFVAVVLFSIRDNVLRWLAVGSSVPPAIAAAAALGGGATVSLAVMGPRLGGRRLRDALPYVPVGFFFG